MYIIEVDPQTVCWCVGLIDKNGKEAFEGDIIRTPVGIAKIIWNTGSNPYDSRIVAGFEAVFMDKESDDLYRHDAGYWLGRGTLIGNIFDNPELLEKTGDKMSQGSRHKTIHEAAGIKQFMRQQAYI